MDTLKRAVPVVWFRLVFRDRRCSIFDADKRQSYAPGHSIISSPRVRLPGRAKKAGKR